VGERLEALGNHFQESGTLLEDVTTDLVGEPGDIVVDDVIDAIGLAVTAWKSEGEQPSLPEEPKMDGAEIPMQMVHWANETLLPLN